MFKSLSGQTFSVISDFRFRLACDFGNTNLFSSFLLPQLSVWVLLWISSSILCVSLSFFSLYLVSLSHWLFPTKPYDLEGLVLGYQDFNGQAGVVGSNLPDTFSNISLLFLIFIILSMCLQKYLYFLVPPFCFLFNLPTQRFRILLLLKKGISYSGRISFLCLFPFLSFCLFLILSLSAHLCP